MPNAFDNFLKQTQQHYGGGIGLGFAAGDIADIASSDNKLKAILATILRIKFEGPMMALGLSQGFAVMRKSILALVHDTGSLEAALKKLAQIQGLQRAFAPFVGGIDAAKRKVAELVLFSAQNNQKLGIVGEAARSLTVYTRGAYDSSAALKTIGDAAAATGNGMDKTADAVGVFYAALRAGDPIAGAAENLRQMGLISQSTVDRLVMLQQNGAGVAQVFGALTSDLAQHRGGMDSLKDSVEGVSTAYEQAKANLKEKFGQPFTEAEIQNTKNMTDAMNAIAPTVGRLAQFFATLTGGFSTFNTWLAKTAASSPVLQSGLELLVKTLGLLVTAVSIVAGLGLGMWLLVSAAGAAAAATSFLGLATATGILATAITALGIAIRVAMIATGVGAILAVLATAAGIFMSYKAASDKAAESLQRLKKGFEDAEKAMQKQIDAADTLVAQHEAIASAIEAVTKAQDEMHAAFGKPLPEYLAAVDHWMKAKDQFDAARKKQAAMPTDEESAANNASVAREKQMTESKWQAEYDRASPERKAAMLTERAGDRQSRYDRAKTGLDTRASYSRAAQEADNDVTAAKGEYENAQAQFVQSSKEQGSQDQFWGAKAREAKRALKAAEAKRAAVDENLPEDSSVYAEMKARKAANPQDRANWQYYAAQRRQEEGNAANLYVGAQEDRSEAANIERERKLTEQRASMELEIANLKSVGVQHAEEEYAIRQRMIAAEIAAEEAKASQDKAKLDQLAAEKAANERNFKESMRGTELERDAVDRQLEAAKAVRAGHGEQAVNLQNLDAYAQHFEKMRQLYGDTPEAKDKALALTNADIERNAPGAVASSLARIGGGGGVADPLIGIAEQQRKLQEDANQYHARIAQATEKLAGGGSNNTPKPYDGT